MFRLPLGPHHPPYPIPSPPPHTHTYTHRGHTHIRGARAHTQKMQDFQSYPRQNKQESIRPSVSSTGAFPKLTLSGLTPAEDRGMQFSGQIPALLLPQQCAWEQGEHFPRLSFLVCLSQISQMDTAKLLLKSAPATRIVHPLPR